ncbi:MAG: hypothetical protein VB064_03155 [Oscillospiraceae bacterium]|nr:hypothetical protein [Oscillospiraceae bacterium]
MNDAQLESFARGYILNYCNIVAIPSQLEFIIPVMVAEDKNKLGSEGINSKGVAGISESYIDGYSAKVTSILNKYRKIKTL